MKGTKSGTSENVEPTNDAGLDDADLAFSSLETSGEVVPEVNTGAVCTTGEVGRDTGAMVLAEVDGDRVFTVGIGTDSKCAETQVVDPSSRLKAGRHKRHQ